jgi:hypothetical protein
MYHCISVDIHYMHISVHIQGLKDAYERIPEIIFPLLRFESSVVERSHSFHIPRNFLRFSTRTAPSF